jgi:2-oxoglutarate ferredoxin oxidoreductase subunit alpha
VLLFPEDPHECFGFGALAFDLADRLQTPIFLMLDLDIGMNEWLAKPLVWDDSKMLDRGKVMGFDALEAGADFGRYLDVDGDGIPYRTWPGTHPNRGAYFTRGTSRDPDARYSEDGPVYVANMERLLAKFDSAKALIPAPIERPARRRTPHGVIYFGSSSAAMSESLQSLEAAGRHVDALRVRGFPFSDAVLDFIAAHETIFVVEQNRDAQLRTLIMTEGGVDPAKLVPILNYDGSPITARFITDEISRRLAGNDLHRQAKASPPPAAAQRAGLHAPGLRGQGLDPVRRLRSRLHIGGDHPGLLRSRSSPASPGQAFRDRLLVEDSRLLPRRLPRLQQCPRAHAFGADRGQPRQPRADLPWRLGRRR